LFAMILIMALAGGGFAAAQDQAQSTAKQPSFALT
jgi:hypothetical protein